MECLSIRPAAEPVSLLRPCCPHTRRARSRVHRAVIVQLACVLGASSAATVRAQRPPPAAAQQRLTPPEPTFSVKATYPPEALTQGKEGSTTVLVTVGKDGVVKNGEIAESSGEAVLDQAALAAALQWRFKPALQDGEPIESQVRIPFHFHLAEHGPAEHPQPPAPSPSPIAPVPAPSPSPSPEPAPLKPAPATTLRTYESGVRGKNEPPSRGVGDFHVDIEKLAYVPRQNATDFLKLVPGVLLTNEGGEGHAEQVFLRGFDAREGQDIEFSVDGTPINEAGNLHGNGYSDTHFIIPELVESLRVVEGPFDPRQGNFAVAGSVDYELGLRQRGLTLKFETGSYGTDRLLLAWGPRGYSDETFAAVELYQTDGFGQNRDGRRARVMAQFAGRSGIHAYRITAQAYIASFHTAGVLRDDDVKAGRKGFFDSYDTNQGEDAGRYSLSAALSEKLGFLEVRNQVFGIARPIRFLENFTGFLLDNQTELQNMHVQRGDLLDNNNMLWTLGARGSARISTRLFKQLQELELGYFARGDFLSTQQSRIEAATGHPYLIDTDLSGQLGDIGLYLDANIHPGVSWIALRGGVRGDLFTFDITNNCANKTVLHPSKTMPPGDASCLTQEENGQHIEQFQRASTVGSAWLPRASLVLGPLVGIGASASYGQGVRSIDPVYISQDLKTPFASATAWEAGLNYGHRFETRVGSIDLALRSLFFQTRVDKDLIFSETAGRNILGGSSTRRGSASAARLTGSFFDFAANLTWTRATFDDTGLLVPYIPDLVFRFDGTLFGDFPGRRLWHKPIRGSFSTGITYVGPRPLPYGERSNTIFTTDVNAMLGWWLFDVGIICTNLFDSRYRLSEFNYVSDFHSRPPDATLVPGRAFSAGAPRMVLFTLSINIGGGR